VGIEVIWEQVKLNFSFRNKFIILLPCDLLLDNNTVLKICVFKSLTGYTVCGGYVMKRDSTYIHIKLMNILSPAGQFPSMDNPLPSVFIHDQQ
jgi:hypothetical protein